MAEYNHELLGTLGVDNESSYPHKLSISVGVDTLGMCTISFGSSYSIRIPEDDVDALRDILNTASVKLMNNRVVEQQRINAARNAALHSPDISHNK